MSALIAQCRREFFDEPKSSVAQKATDGLTTLFNIGKFPILESSYAIKANTSALVENAVSGYTINLDNGDITTKRTYANGILVTANFKYTNWRDQNWMEAINQSIDILNGKGFFRQTVRQQFGISANVRTFSLPSAAVEVYEILESDNGTTSGNMRIPQVNWSYQQDAGKLVFGQFPTAANIGWYSYLRNMKTYGATSATVDVKDDWLELLKKKAGAMYARSMAAKIAQQGNANIDEGHFSFTNLRTLANDIDNDFDKMAKVKKPTRPAVSVGYALSTGGPQP